MHILHRRVAGASFDIFWSTFSAHRNSSNLSCNRGKGAFMIWLLMIEGMNRTNILIYRITVWPEPIWMKFENLVTNTTAASKQTPQWFKKSNFCLLEKTLFNGNEISPLDLIDCLLWKQCKLLICSWHQENETTNWPIHEFKMPSKRKSKA